MLLLSTLIPWLSRDFRLQSLIKVLANYYAKEITGIRPIKRLTIFKNSFDDYLIELDSTRAREISTIVAFVASLTAEAASFYSSRGGNQTR